MILEMHRERWWDLWGILESAMEGFWKQKAFLNWLWCEWGRTRRIVWKWEQYGDFPSNTGKKAVIFCLKCSTDCNYFLRAWRRIQDQRWEFCSVSCADHRWRILFTLVLRAVKLPKNAESSRLHLPFSKQKYSLHMHAGLLDACKTGCLPEDLIMLLLLANF